MPSTSRCPGGPAGIVCNVTSAPGQVIGHVVTSAADSAFHGMAEAMASAATGLLKTLTATWMQVDTPQLTGAASPATTIMDGTRWITTSVAVVCILVAATRMAIRRRGEPASAMALGLARLVTVSVLATFLVQLAGSAGDELSAQLVRSASVGANTWSGLISVTGLSAAFATGDGTLLTIAVVIVVATLIQLMMMVMRVGLLIILTGTLPLAAAASMSDWGENWWRKHLGWLAAWLAYKPAAAVLFASAMVLTHAKHSFAEVAAGFMILVLMVFLLPALLRLIAPVTSSLGAASGGALALGAAGAVATGASRLGGMNGIRSMVAAASGGGESEDPGGQTDSSGGNPGRLSPGSAEMPDGADSTESGSADTETSSSERISGDSSLPDGSGIPDGSAAGQEESPGAPGANGAGLDGADEASSAVLGEVMPGSASGSGNGDVSSGPAATGAQPDGSGPLPAELPSPKSDSGPGAGPPGASASPGDLPTEIGG